MEILSTALLSMLPALVVFIIFMIITYKEELVNLFNKIKEKLKSDTVEIKEEKKEDIVIDFNEEFFKIIKPDGTEFYKKKPNPAESIKASSNEILPYVRREILTNTEWKFWAVLADSCKSYKIIICPKVRMEDFLKITVPYNNRTIYDAYRNKVKSRHIDFILCDKNMHLLAGIELDDKTHLTEDAKAGDELKNAVFHSIGIPLYRIKTNSNYKTVIDLILRDIFK